MNDDFRLLLEESLQGLASAASQILDALPAMAEACVSAALRQALDGHLAETERQAERLQRVADLLEVEPDGGANEEVEGMLAGIDDLLEVHPRGPVLDAALLGAARRLLASSAVAYGTLRGMARAAGLEEAAALLGASQAAERALDERLCRLAEEEVHPAALRGQAA
ncbi:MAG TPA: DUF892 family protein [Acetobacteraceae bacterium]|jgi:ferritin-like metal-binding protein YciE|nr:DUF892 family protein [Acetobacteraceae bacterium]